MEDAMTDFQFKTIIKIILDVMKSSKNLEEAIQKVEEYLRDEQKK